MKLSEIKIMYPRPERPVDNWRKKIILFDLYMLSIILPCVIYILFLR